MEGMHALILLRVKLLALELVALGILGTPRSALYLFLEEVFVLELLVARANLLLLLVALVFVKSRLFRLLADSVPFLAQDQLLPSIRNSARLYLELTDSLIIDGDAHGRASAGIAVKCSFHALLSVLGELTERGSQALDSISEVASLFEQIGVVDAELGVHDDVGNKRFSGQNSVNHAERLNKLVLDLDDVLVEAVDKLAEELLLVPHLHVLVDPL